jgi:hypothetical protein
VIVIRKHFNPLFLYQVNLFFCVPETDEPKSDEITNWDPHSPKDVACSRGESYKNRIYLSFST